MLDNLSMAFNTQAGGQTSKRRIGTNESTKRSGNNGGLSMVLRFENRLS